jgi:hypothetical protein
MESGRRLSEASVSDSGIGSDPSTAIERASRCEAKDFGESGAKQCSMEMAFENKVPVQVAWAWFATGEVDSM